jgi:hypothetical protein
VVVSFLLLVLFLAAPEHGPRYRDTTTSQVGLDSAGNRAPVEPDLALTPGATLPVTVDDICASGYSRKVRDVPAEVKRAVYRRYGIHHHRKGEYEMDHLISLELGGSNSERNLWPESNWTTPWNARTKDALENALHREVCAGRVPLATAQHEIASDWIAAYRKYVHVRKRKALES